MRRKPQLLNSTLIAQSRLFDIESMHLRFTSGQERHYERVCGRTTDSVMIVPLLDCETMLLIREYGAGIDDYVLGFPKGAVEMDEDLLATAQRELKEEVGYRADNLSIIARFSASPSYMCSMMHVILAQDLSRQIAVGDEPDPIQVIPWKFSDIDSLLRHPEFHEARSVAALFVAQRELHGK